MKNLRLKGALFITYRYSIISASMLFVGLLLDFFESSWFQAEIRWIWYLFIYVLIGKGVLLSAIRLLMRGGVFNEFFLMSIATLGAIYLGELAEAVSVMLFYTVGEQVQHSAVKGARKNIRTMLEQVPESLIKIDDGMLKHCTIDSIVIGDIVLYRAGDQVVLDGELQSGEAEFDTSSSTGESMPKTLKMGDEVLAGFIVLDQSVKVKVLRRMDNSATARIVKLVEKAAEKKSKSERFISSFAKIYTPIVVFAALGVVFLPYLFMTNYDFELWMYRALVFLVISCPCALVISIPLGYFGGLGASARKGIFFKGANYLDRIAKLDTVFFDKTGTLTENLFEISEMELFEKNNALTDLEAIIYAMTSRSSHPVSLAINKKIREPGHFYEMEVRELPGLGLKASFNGKQIVLGSLSLMKREGAAIPTSIKNEDNIVLIAVDDQLAGRFILTEKLKKGIFEVLQDLGKLGVRSTGILSGDRSSKVAKLKQVLKMKWGYGDLLPEDKLKILNHHKSNSKNLAYVGDGINDGPVLALADVGIAMGRSGSDVAVEAADVVIHDDKLERIPQGIKIGRKTREIVWQNIVLAISIKLLILTLGASGMASLWEAIFADVGVALLAILNALRIK